MKQASSRPLKAVGGSGVYKMFSPEPPSPQLLQICMFFFQGFGSREVSRRIRCTFFKQINTFGCQAYQLWIQNKKHVEQHIHNAWLFLFSEFVSEQTPTQILSPSPSAKHVPTVILSLSGFHWKDIWFVFSNGGSTFSWKALLHLINPVWIVTFFIALLLNYEVQELPEPSQSPPRALPDPRAPPDPSQEFSESLLVWAAREGSGLLLGGPMEGQMLSSIVNKSNLELFITRLG